jgi:methylated-DNA-[protein]-cysteine S-methyltransferase
MLPAEAPVRALTLPSPVGPLVLAASGHAITALLFGERSLAEVPRGETPLLVEARRQLEAYFAGARVRFELPLAPSGTPFQLRVWEQLLAIPFGETWSYQRVADAIGQPTATRAVGASNGRNPISIIVPCHRVIGADGSLTGYGGGLPAKRWLLAHEARRAQPSLPGVPAA